MCVILIITYTFNEQLLSPNTVLNVLFGFSCSFFQGILQGRDLGIRHSKESDFNGGRKLSCA